MLPLRLLFIFAFGANACFQLVSGSVICAAVLAEFLSAEYVPGSTEKADSELEISSFVSFLVTHMRKGKSECRADSSENYSDGNADKKHGHRRTVLRSRLRPSVAAICAGRFARPNLRTPVFLIRNFRLRPLILHPRRVPR